MIREIHQHGVMAPTTDAASFPVFFCVFPNQPRKMRSQSAFHMPSPQQATLEDVTFLQTGLKVPCESSS